MHPYHTLTGWVSKSLSRLTIVATLMVAAYGASMGEVRAQTASDEASAAQCRYGGGYWNGYSCRYPDSGGSGFPDLFETALTIGAILIFMGAFDGEGDSKAASTARQQR